MFCEMNSVFGFEGTMKPSVSLQVQLETESLVAATLSLMCQIKILFR